MTVGSRDVKINGGIHAPNPITGANSGLGFAVSRIFARRGAHTILQCRDKTRGEEAVKKMLQETPKASVDLMICDFSSMDSTQRFIADFKAKYSRLDILLNNAAVMMRKRTIIERLYFEKLMVKDLETSLKNLKALAEQEGSDKS